MLYSGRQFEESERYELEYRLVAGLSSNNVWLSTVDAVIETESQERVVQIVRWRARNKGDQLQTKVWTRHRWYNIRSEEQWMAASNHVEAMLQKFKLKGDDRFKVAEIAYTEPEGDGQNNKGLERQVLEAQALEQLHLVSKRRATRRLREMKRHIKVYKKTISDMKGLVENESTTETELHRFIEARKPFWMFGLEYTDIESKVRFPPRSKKFEFDFMLSRLDGYLDLVELKGPNENLFDSRTQRRSKLNVSLSTALGQVLTYLNECDRNQTLKLFKPKAIIVIGKKSSDNPHERRLLSSHIARVEIFTYSELLDHGERLIKHIESRKSR